MSMYMQRQATPTTDAATFLDDDRELDAKELAFLVGAPEGDFAKSLADAATFLDDDGELDAEELAFLAGAPEGDGTNRADRHETSVPEVRRFLTIVAEQARRAFANTDAPGMLQLSRLEDGGGLVPTRFTIDDVEEMVKLAVADSEAGHNVYVEGRTVKRGVTGNQRGTFEDTAFVFALVIDADADKAMGWSGSVEASLVVETSPGNAHHWFFLEHAITADEAGALGERVRASAGADFDTGTITQPYRVAGTVNHPNRAKRARGRMSCATRVLKHTQRLWTPERLTAAFPVPQKEKGTGKINGKTNGRRRLPDDFGSDAWFKRIESGRYGLPNWVAPCVREGVPVGKRSEAFLQVVAELKYFSLSVDNIVALLEQYPGGIAAKYQGRLRTEVERVYDKLESEEDRDDPVARLNERHAVVRMGTKTMILDERKGECAVFMPVEEFNKWYANETVVVGTRRKPVSRLWFTNPRRRQYEKVVFDPGDENPEHYNLWKGFAVAPDVGKSCEKLLAHVEDNICAGNEEHYRWVIGYLAHMVQRPWEKPGVALVMRGEEGVGKGFFASVLGRLCPHHYVVVSQAAHLTGRFNSHHAQCLLMFVDEGFWAGDKQGEGALKHLVTDHELLIEQKGVDAFMVRNVTRLIVASNEDWVVPAGAQARRWCVLDVGNAHACDRRYFGDKARTGRRRPRGAHAPVVNLRPLDRRRLHGAEDGGAARAEGTEHGAARALVVRVPAGGRGPQARGRVRGNRQ
jgi:Family of unknown function (DUF5906)